MLVGPSLYKCAACLTHSLCLIDISLFRHQVLVASAYTPHDLTELRYIFIPPLLPSLIAHHHHQSILHLNHLPTTPRLDLIFTSCRPTIGRPHVVLWTLAVFSCCLLCVSSRSRSRSPPRRGSPGRRSRSRSPAYRRSPARRDRSRSRSPR